MSAVPLRPDGRVDLAALLRETSGALSERDLRGVPPWVGQDEPPLPPAPAYYDPGIDSAYAAVGKNAYPEPESEREWQVLRIWRALVLAPDIATCEALLRGEAVPLSRLDPLWAARLRRGQQEDAA